jgi:hypothetical protein
MTLSRYTLLLSSVVWTTNAWISSSIEISNRRGRPFFASQGDFVDVDFERISESSKDDDATTNKEVGAPKNLFDASLVADSDLDWSQVRIPFCRGQEYIDGKLTFTIDMEGVTYGIAIPYDDAVAIVEESPKLGNILYVRPDEEDETGEGLELMEIMAKQVQENLGEGELELRKTPKVLTISGGLSKYTENWEMDLVPKSATVKELLEDDDPEIAEFYEFMRKELGDKEFEKTLKEDPKDIDPEMLKAFNVPGLGDQADDMKGLEAMLKDMVEEEQQDVVKEAQAFQPNTEGMALKLIGFNFGDGSKAYSLVKLLQPYTLVGKYIMDDGDEEGIKFELLTEQEEKLIIPKLEELCRQDLETAGLSLTNAKPSKIVTPE